MGIEARQETFAPGEVKKLKCKCFLFPLKEGQTEPARLCFRKNYIGALNDEQIHEFCTEGSTLPKSQGGSAKDANSEQVRSIVRTINEFTLATTRAKETYAKTGKRDMDKWRATVATEMKPTRRLDDQTQTVPDLLATKTPPAAPPVATPVVTPAPAARRTRQGKPRETAQERKKRLDARTPAEKEAAKVKMAARLAGKKDAPAEAVPFEKQDERSKKATAEYLKKQRGEKTE